MHDQRRVRRCCRLAALALAATCAAHSARAAPASTPAPASTNAAESPPTEPSAEAPSSAAAGRSSDGEPVSVDLRVDIPVSVAAGMLAGGLQLGREDILRDRCSPACAEAALNGLDRPFAGRYLPAAATTSDVLLYVGLGLPLVLDLLEVGMGEHPDDWLGFGQDTLILAETLAVNAAAQALTSFAMQRPRPFAYGERADLEKRTGANAYLSFYSGHTSTSFAAATAYAYLFGVRHPHSPWRAAVWVLGEGLAAMDGSLRVTAGYHFPTDVLVGAAVGTSLGVLVPWLHTRASAPADEPSSGDEGSAAGGAAQRAAARLDWLLLPSVAPGSVGLSVLLR
jgi:membrane-associated phospholipid phosphatase